MPVSVAPKKAVKRKASGSSSHAISLTAATTLSSDANARQVTRAEFQELSSVVAQLKKDLARSQTIVSQLESDLQLSSAQVSSNKASMGTLADLVLEKTSELETHVASQLQLLQIESAQRLTDVQLALERLAFRFKHHVRDCETIAEQTDAHTEGLQTLRSQLAQTQNIFDTQREEQKAFTAAMQFTATVSKSKTAAAVDECVKKLESFEQRIVAYVKTVEADVQEPMQAIIIQLRDLEIRGQRQGTLIHRALDDVATLRQTLSELSALKSLVQHQHEHYDRLHDEASSRALVTEKRVGQLLALLETCSDRAEVQRQVERLESNVKMRLEAVQELVALCVESVARRQSSV